MKKLLIVTLLLALPFAMRAQTKYHDVELNEATGAVKTIRTQLMGQDIVITFTEDGKMQREGMTDAKYDANGYMLSAKMSMRGMEVQVTYQWENGKLKSQSMNMMGQTITISRTYNEKGAPATESINMGGQEMSSPYTDYKYDDHGNWISRKGTMMGQEMVQTRSIEYF
jgi:antitoxin component YwqK of YwqJK toxin-antitoxin module